jgi:hypothetical protein
MLPSSNGSPEHSAKAGPGVARGSSQGRTARCRENNAQVEKVCHSNPGVLQLWVMVYSTAAANRRWQSAFMRHYRKSEQKVPTTKWP